MHIQESVPNVRAKVRIRHERPFEYDGNRGLWLFRPVGEDEEVFNLLTNTGRVQIHNFVYGTTPRSNGFNYIGLSDDATPPSATDTSLTAELTGFGLDRAQGTVTLPVGTGNQTVVVHVFTYTGGAPQGVQKAAVFDSAVGGVMNHEVQFTERTLFANDTLTISYTITAG